MKPINVLPMVMLLIVVLFVISGSEEPSPDE